MTSIHKSVDEIREIINKTHMVNTLIKEPDKWSMLCSSMDTIEDAEHAIIAYKSCEYPKDQGVKYLWVYGIFQAMILQQDAVNSLYESLNQSYSRESELKDIREVRNKSIGHPTKQDWGKEPTSYNHISMPTLERTGFELLTFYAGKREDDFQTINILADLDTQNRLINADLEEMIRHLKQSEREHKEMYRDDKLVDCFPSSLDYEFQKLKGLTWSSGRWKLRYHHLNIVIKAVNSYRDKLLERALDINEEFDMIDFAVNSIQHIFDNTPSDTRDYNLYIYVFFLEKSVRALKEMAQEIDKEFIKNVE